jgi:hypothetical protein
VPCSSALVEAESPQPSSGRRWLTALQAATKAKTQLFRETEMVGYFFAIVLTAHSTARDTGCCKGRVVELVGHVGEGCHVRPCGNGVKGFPQRALVQASCTCRMTLHISSYLIKAKWTVASASGSSRCSRGDASGNGVGSE